MQSPRSAAAVSLPLLQRSGLSASHPDPAASLETADGLSSSPSHLLSSVSTPRQEYCWSGVDAAEAPQFSHAHTSTALTLHPIAGSAGNTGIAGIQLGVSVPPLGPCQLCFGGSEDCHVSLVPSSRVQRIQILLDPRVCCDVAQMKGIDALESIFLGPGPPSTAKRTGSMRHSMTTSLTVSAPVFTSR